MLCTKFPLGAGDSYMTNELAGALAGMGNSVQVVVTDWDAALGAPPISLRVEPGIDVLSLAPVGVRRLGRFIARASKWTFSSLIARRRMSQALSGRTFDVVICFTPCVTVAAQLLWVTKRSATRNILFIHDFFPLHHRSIGLVPAGPVFAIARRLENLLIRRFHVVVCNWPGNVAYLRKHYRLRPQQRVTDIPLWSEIASAEAAPKGLVRARNRLPLDRKIIVFGGQITEGRGVEDMLAAAGMARDTRPDLAFLFVGDGRLFPLVERGIAAGLTNTVLMHRVPRDDYLSLLAACDVGLVATVAGVDSASFPTKTIDYLRASLPIVAAVEPESDFRAFLDKWGIGISVATGDARALFLAIERIVDDPQAAAAIVERATICLKEVFDVRRTAARLIELASSA